MYHASNTHTITGSFTILEPSRVVRLSRRTVQSVVVSSGVCSALGVGIYAATQFVLGCSGGHACKAEDPVQTTTVEHLDGGKLW